MSFQMCPDFTGSPFYPENKQATGQLIKFACHEATCGFRPGAFQLSVQWPAGFVFMDKICFRVRPHLYVLVSCSDG